MREVHGVTAICWQRVERTGLDDFGDESFREGLEILTRSLRDEARLNARGEGFIYVRASGAPAPAPAGRGLVPPPPRDRRGVGDRAVVRARLAPHRIHRAELPARPGSGRPLPAQLGVRAAVPAAVDGGRRRSADSAIGGQRCWQAAHHVPVDVHGPMECLDLMALDFKSQIFQAFAQIPGVLPVAGRAGRLHLHLRLPASGAQTAGLGRTAAAMAARRRPRTCCRWITSTPFSPMPAS